MGEIDLGGQASNCQGAADLGEDEYSTLDQKHLWVSLTFEVRPLIAKNIVSLTFEVRPLFAKEPMTLGKKSIVHLIRNICG